MRWLSPPDSVPERARQREIIEPDVDQELQPLADLLQHAHADLVLLGVELLRAASVNHSPARLTDHVGDLRDVHVGDLDAQRLGLEAAPLQASQGMSVKYFCSSSRAHSLSVSLKRRSRLVMTPSNGFLVV